MCRIKLKTDIKSNIYFDFYQKEFDNIEQHKQTQISLKNQIDILIPFAEKLGLYDVADYLKNSIK